MRYEVRLRVASMRLVRNEPGPGGNGATVSDAIWAAGAPGGPGERLNPDAERLDPDVQRAADVLRRWANRGPDPDQAREELVGFLRSPARHRADPFKLSLYAELGELSARRRRPGSSRGR